MFETNASTYSAIWAFRECKYRHNFPFGKEYGRNIIQRKANRQAQKFTRLHSPIRKPPIKAVQRVQQTVRTSVLRCASVPADMQTTLRTAAEQPSQQHRRPTELDCKCRLTSLGNLAYVSSRLNAFLRTQLIPIRDICQRQNADIYLLNSSGVDSRQYLYHSGKGCHTEKCSPSIVLDSRYILPSTHLSNTAHSELSAGQSGLLE